MFSYWGYGKSTGSPRSRIKTDAQVKWMIIYLRLITLFYFRLLWIDFTECFRGRKEENLRLWTVYGAAVSINLVSRNNDKVRGLIIENTFLSIPRLMPDLSVLLYTFIPIMNQIFDSASDIQRITTLILFHPEVQINSFHQLTWLNYTRSQEERIQDAPLLPSKMVDMPIQVVCLDISSLFYGSSQILAKYDPLFWFNKLLEKYILLGNE